MHRVKGDMTYTLPDSAKQPKEINNKREQSAENNIDAGQSWYLVHCKPNGEKIALRNLENQGFSSFLPLQKLTSRKGAVFKTKLRPLFPGYIFVAQEPASGHWRKINSTRGVSRLVCLGTEPTPVPPTIIEQLLVRCDKKGVFTQSSALVAGTDAKITQGPFAGAVAKIVEIDACLRVHLLLDFMGQKSMLKIDATSVAPTV